MGFSKKLNTTSYWQGVNRWFKEMRNDNRLASYITQLKDDADLASYCQEIRGWLADESGLDGATFDTASQASGIPSTGADLWKQYVDGGIPWQVWRGKLTHPRYVKVEAGGTMPTSYMDSTGSPTTNNTGHAVYVPMTGPGFRDSCSKLRKKIYDHRTVITKLIDIANTNTNHHLNPGGKADATKN